MFSSEKVVLNTQILRSMDQNYKSLKLICNAFNYEAFCHIVMPIMKHLFACIALLNILVTFHSKNADALGSVIAFGLFLGAVYLYLLLVVATNIMSGFWKTSMKYRKMLKSQLHTFSP